KSFVNTPQSTMAKITSKQQKKYKVGHSLNPDRVLPRGTTHLRSRSTVNRLLMYKQKYKTDKDGNVIRGSVLSANDKFKKGEVARIAPDRNYFGNTHVIGQKELQKFR